MGQTLSEPIVTKNTASCSNSRYNIGSSSMQGWRISMEDAHVHLLEMPNDHAAAFFAVFDGHGGARIAKYASQYLHKEIEETEAYSDGRISDALIDGFLSLDVQMRDNAELKEEMSGSTAVAVLIKNNCIYCANAGDSRAVASIAGKAVPLSTDHKPSNEEESRRIFAAGGWVEFNRVNGNLALSRALGDFAFKNNENMSAKEQIVTAYPDVETHSITADHEFVILACDGIWDVMSNQEVVDFCREKLIDGMAPDKICEELLNKCLAPDCELSGLGCDNMSCILVCLSQDRSPEEYLKQLKSVKYIGEEDDHQNIRTTEISSTGGIGNELDENEIGEEIFSTPSHSPPLTALTATVAVAEEEEECSRNDGTTSTAQTETSDEDLPPNQFKVQQEEPKEEQNEEELDCDTNKMTLERQEPEPTKEEEDRHEPQPTKDEDDDQRIIEE